MNTIEVITKECFICGKASTVVVPLDGWTAYKKGAFVQDAFPSLTADEREQLLTGVHGPCFDLMFPPDEGDEDPEFGIEGDEPF